MYIAIIMFTSASRIITLQEDAVQAEGSNY